VLYEQMRGYIITRVSTTAVATNVTGDWELNSLQTLLITLAPYKPNMGSLPLFQYNLAIGRYIIKRLEKNALVQL